MAPREINRGEIERTVVALAQGYAAEGETVTLTTNMGDCLSRENLHVVEFAGQLEGEFGIDTIPHDHLRFLTNRNGSTEIPLDIPAERLHPYASAGNVAAYIEQTLAMKARP